MVSPSLKAHVFFKRRILSSQNTSLTHSHGVLAVGNGILAWEPGANQVTAYMNHKTAGDPQIKLQLKLHVTK